MRYLNPNHLFANKKKCIYIHQNLEIGQISENITFMKMN